MWPQPAVNYVYVISYWHVQPWAPLCPVNPGGHAPGHNWGRSGGLPLCSAYLPNPDAVLLLPCLHTGSQVPILGHFGFLSHYPRLNPTACQMSASISFLWEPFWALPPLDSVVPHIGPKIHPFSFVMYEDHMGQYCHCPWWRRSSRPGKSPRDSQVYMPMLIFLHRIPGPVLRGVLQVFHPRTRAGKDCPYHVINIWEFPAMWSSPTTSHCHQQGYGDLSGFSLSPILSISHSDRTLFPRFTVNFVSRIPCHLIFYFYYTSHQPLLPGPAFPICTIRKLEKANL